MKKRILYLSRQTGLIMLLRKLYIKIRLYLYSVRKTINKCAVIAMITTLVYLFVNNIFVPRFILAKADLDQINHKYSSAINFYNLSSFYYKINHFSKDNKNIYFKIPYDIAICYLYENKKKESIESMLNSITAIQEQYGIFSSETAYFMRKYLIKYYLDNNQIRLAQQEFKNLIVIYKMINYNYSEMSDLIYLKGDLYYHLKRYDDAMDCYQKAYNILITQQDIDYEIFYKIVDRMCDYKIINRDSIDAIELYKKSVDVLKESGKKQDELTASMLLKLGNLYTKQGSQTKAAIKCYEESIEIIKKLPANNYFKQNINEYLLTLENLYNDDGQFHKVDEINVELSRKRRFSFLY